MSIKVMSAVWQHSTASGSSLLVLLAIADYADDQGRAFPAIPTLQNKARLSHGGIFRAINSLKKSGELRVLPQRGPHGCNLYQIAPLPVQKVDRPESGPVQSVDEFTLSPVQSVDSTRPKSGPKPSKIHQAEDPSLEPPPEVTEYGEFRRCRLTDAQYDKLKARLGEDALLVYIQRFDRFVNEAPDAKISGVKRKDRHAYESILNWYGMDGGKR